MATLISLEFKTQQPYYSIKPKEVDFAIKASPFEFRDGLRFPIIAKGNIIEGIEARD